MPTDGNMVLGIVLTLSLYFSRVHDVESHGPLFSSVKTSLPIISSNKMNLTSPKRGPKREDGWKEVVRR